MKKVSFRSTNLYRKPWLALLLQASLRLGLGQVPASGWIDAPTVTLTQSTTNLLDTTATNFPQRFYRAVSP